MTAKERRQLDRMSAALDRWWNTLPLADRMPYYAPTAIEAATGAGIQALAPALRRQGWQRVQVRIDGPARIVWVAPGEASPLRPRGRPRANR